MMAAMSAVQHGSVCELTLGRGELRLLGKALKLDI